MTRFLFTADEVLVQRIMKYRIHTDERGQTYTNCVVTAVAGTPNAPSRQWAVRGKPVEK